MKTMVPQRPNSISPEHVEGGSDQQRHHSPELADELKRLETEERVAADRRKQEEIARLREQSRHD